MSDLPVQYDFPDAPLPSPPAAGIGLIYEPPYYAYWHNDNLKAIEDSCMWLRSYITGNGPYDVVMAFSQGAMLVSSMLLRDAAGRSNALSSFKAAIFISGGPPLTIMDSLGFEIPEDTWQRDRISRLTLDVQLHHQNSKETWQGPSLLKGEITEEELRVDIAGPWKIPIPTIHIYGSKDPRYEAGVELSGLCDSVRRECYTHDGTHEIPRSPIINEEIARLIRRLLCNLGR